MDRIAPAATAPQAEQPSTGDGSTFRAVALGTSTERRRRSTGGLARAGRALASTDPGGDSGTWRLAL